MKDLQFEQITPEKAKKYLEMNNKGIRNRKLDKQRVYAYMSDIKSGNWKTNLDPIAFSIENGRLLNGQHRLTAISMQEKAVECLIAYVPDDTVFDRGKVRTTLNQFYMDGSVDDEFIDNSTLACVKQYIRIAEGQIHHYNPTDAEVRNFILTFPMEIREMKSMLSEGKANGMCRKRTIGAALLGALIQGENPRRIRKFAETVNTGFASREEDFAGIAFRNQLLNMTAEKRLNPNEMTELTETALYDFIKEKVRKKPYRAYSSKFIKKVEKGHWLTIQ